MQFAGECPHGRAVVPPHYIRVGAVVAEKGMSAGPYLVAIASLMMPGVRPPGIKP